MGDIDTAAKKAKDLRDEQSQNFENAKKDLESTIAAIKNATKALQDSKGDFMQVAKSQVVRSALEFAGLAEVAPKDQDMVATLLQEEPLLANTDQESTSRSTASSLAISSNSSNRCLLILKKSSALLPTRRPILKTNLTWQSKHVTHPVTWQRSPRMRRPNSQQGSRGILHNLDLLKNPPPKILKLIARAWEASQLLA